MSYSHAVDGRLAPALQSALHGFAKPWYRMRAVRVFRDEATLAANPGLWASIEAALKDSEFFILLASPEAAASEWVSRELKWWISNKDSQNVLIVLTGGEMAWDKSAGDIDWSVTSALPPSVQGAFHDEPRHVDLRWAAQEDHLSMNDPRFRSCVADIAAPLHHRPKDELFGEDVRQHRRAMRIARAAGASLAALTVVASIAAILAVQHQREATAQARVAISRQLAVTATDVVDAQFDLALLLAVEALRTRDTPQARASLFTVLERNPQHVAFLHGAGAATTIAKISADGSLLAAGQANGVVSLWKLPEARPVGELRLSSPSSIESLTIAPDGARLAAGTGDGKVVVWNVSSAQGHEAVRHEHPVRAVVFSPDGKWLASGDARGSVLVADVSTRRQIAALEHAREAASGGEAAQVAVRGLSFGGDGRRLSAAGRGLVTTWDITSRRVLAQREPAWSPSVTDSAFSEDLSLYAESVGKGGYSLAVTSTDGHPSPSSSVPAQNRPEPALLPGDPDTLAFSPDAGLLAAAGQGSIRLFERESLRPNDKTPLLTGYPSAVTSVSISTDGRWLAATSGDVVVLSDLTRQHRLGRIVAEPEEVCGTCAGGNTVSISPDGRYVAWLDDGRNARGDSSPIVRLWDLANNTEMRGFPVDAAGTIAFHPDGKSLVSASPVSVWDLNGNRLGGIAPAIPDRDVLRERALAVSFTKSGRGLILSAVEDRDFRWRLLVRDADTGGVRFEGPRVDDVPVAALSSRGTVAFASADGSVTLWDVQRGRSMAVLPTATPMVGARSPMVDDLAFSSDGAQLASMSGGTVTVWDVESQRQQFALRGGSRGTLRFAPDGSRLAAASQDGTLTVWDLASRQLLATVRGQPPFNGFPHLAFTPDGTILVSVVPGGGLLVAEMNASRWQGEACAIAGRDLTRVERDNYLAGGLAPRFACRETG